MVASTAKRSRRQVHTTRVRLAGRSPKRRGKPTELNLRRKPMQARGQATFERILDATAKVLEKVGTDALTTNLIARTAKVNVATLYQYFPNKQAVLLALFKRHNGTRVELGQRLLGGMAQNGDWRSRVARGIQAAAEARRNMGGAAALRLAMRSSPDLLEHDRDQLDQLAATLARELNESGVREEKARLVARCAVEALTALLDLGSTEDSDARVVEQATDLLTAYLAPYLDKSRGARLAKSRRS
jgi:AcrR family transcriptional regulator